jgi:hypothetical protein
MANCSSSLHPRQSVKETGRALCSKAAFPWVFGWLYHMSQARASNTQGVGCSTLPRDAMAKEIERPT